MVIHQFYQTVDMEFALSLPRGGYRLLPPAREYGGECSCEAGIRSNKEGALRESRVECSTKHDDDERRQSCV